MKRAANQRWPRKHGSEFRSHPKPSTRSEDGKMHIVLPSLFHTNILFSPFSPVERFFVAVCGDGAAPMIPYSGSA